MKKKEKKKKKKKMKLISDSNIFHGVIPYVMNCNIDCSVIKKFGASSSKTENAEVIR